MFRGKNIQLFFIQRRIDMSNFESYKNGMHQYLTGETVDDRLAGLREMCSAEDQDLHDECWKNYMNHVDNSIEIAKLKCNTKILADSALILSAAVFTLSMITIKNRKDKKAMRKRIENLEKFVGYKEETVQEEEKKEKDNAMMSLKMKIEDVAREANENPFWKK